MQPLPSEVVERGVDLAMPHVFPAQGPQVIIGRMTPARLLIGLLLVATVLVDVVVWSVLRLQEPHGTQGFATSHQLFWSLGICQAGLLAVWTGLGGSSLPWRLLVTMVFAWGWGEIGAGFVERLPREFILSILCLQLWAPSLFIVSFVLAARLAGYTLERSPDLSLPLNDIDQRPFQFSLGCLLSWLTVTGIVLGLVRSTINLQLLAEGLNRQNTARVAVFSLCDAVMILAAVETVLGKGWKRLLRFALVVGGVLAIFVWLHRLGLAWFSVLNVLLQLGWLLGSLWVVRVAGYRLTWRDAHSTA